MLTTRILKLYCLDLDHSISYNKISLKIQTVPGIIMFFPRTKHLDKNSSRGNLHALESSLKLVITVQHSEGNHERQTSLFPEVS